MKITRWLPFSLAVFFLSYDDCNPGEVDEIEIIIQTKSFLNV